MFIKPGMEKVVTEIFDMVTTEGRWVKSGVHRMTIAGIDFDAHFYEDRNHMGDVMSTYHRLEAVARESWRQPDARICRIPNGIAIDTVPPA